MNVLKAVHSAISLFAVIMLDVNSTDHNLKSNSAGLFPDEDFGEAVC